MIVPSATGMTPVSWFKGGHSKNSSSTRGSSPSGSVSRPRSLMVMGASARHVRTFNHGRHVHRISARTFIVSPEHIVGVLRNQAQPSRAAVKNVVNIDEWDMRGWVDLAPIRSVPFLGSFGFRWTIIVTKVIFKREITRRYRGSHSTAYSLFNWFDRCSLLG